ncbi:hypothetical protein J6590_007065 [Homalodisca vitripennis]|nr:hypothetical protein J6590_007065 [Homalodisca vitripennis]
MPDVPRPDHREWAASAADGSRRVSAGANVPCKSSDGVQTLLASHPPLSLVLHFQGDRQEQQSYRCLLITRRECGDDCGWRQGVTQRLARLPHKVDKTVSRQEAGVDGRISRIQAWRGRGGT